jgi:threonine dehydratase
MHSPAVNLGAIRDASAHIRTNVKRTPVMTSHGFNSRAGVLAYLKCENLQTTGSFKIRGATNFIRCLTPEAREKGVVAFSSGNHAQAVAYAARKAGIRATVVMPYDAPKSKIEATRDQGAEILHYDRLKDDREALGRKVAEETGASLIPPYDHPWTVIGQGTCGLELIEEIPDIDALVVCTGGGGLLAGCATAVRGVNPHVRVFGAEPELANDWYLSVREGHPVAVDPSKTIADGLRTPYPGNVTFPIVQRLVEDILLVTEDEIKETVKYLAGRMKIVAEPSGAVAAAAVLFGKLPHGFSKVGITISGGNVDWDLLKTL